MAIPFLPKSEIAVDGASIHQWLPMKSANAETFINRLVTSAGDADAGQTTFNDLISGVPTPWARAKMTGYALATNTNDYSDSRTLTLCYRALKNEWRGLMATYILFPDRFALSEPILLKGKHNPESLNIPATYGEMLFNEKALWRHEADSRGPAAIQLLYYGERQANKRLVGATSPYSIFFASINSQVEGDLPWIVDGKFTDPASPDIRRRVDRQQLETIYSFLTMLTTNRDSYREALGELLGTDKTKAREVDHILRAEIQAWSREIEQALGDDFDRDNAVPLRIRTEVVPKGPLSKLFVTNTKYWWHGGVFFQREHEGALEIEDISELLLPGSYLVGWMAMDSTDKDVIGKESDFDSSAVYYLKAKADDSNNVFYFSLPLTEKAIDIFGSLNGIIDGDVNSKVRLRAKVRANEVVVILEAKLGDSNEFVEILSKAYEMVLADIQKKVFVWPNFKSEYWQQYFYYSEFPTNMPGGVRMIPEFEGKNFEQSYINGSSGSAGFEEWLQKMFMVKYPVDKANTGMWPYEIIKSDTPLKYVSIHVRRNERDWTAGRLVVKTPGGDGDMVRFGNSAYMKVLNRNPDVCEKAVVGIDFGSTNTCAYYKTRGMRDAEPMPFSNHRLAIAGFDNAPHRMAAKDELLFISNEEPINGNGQIKSWLHEHDSQYTNAAQEDEPIIGGVPVNETNITVHSMNDYIIQTNAGRLNYNMKWARGENERKRKSFISMIWLHVCADLFGKEIVPSELRWSFPSAMTDTSSLSQVFRNITDEIGKTIKGARISQNKSFTEAEAVCVYAQGYSAAVTPTNLFLGIDIGGSTSDILILGHDPKDFTGGGKRLYSQCSVRVAAGMFFDAINRSEQFRKALYSFHESHRTSVNVLNIADVISPEPQKFQRAPYYLNNVFDQLKSRQEFTYFYDHLRSNVPSAFALPAYITGLLSFYAGILLRETIIKNNLPTDEVRFRYYGKGGRLFEWLFFTLEENGLEARRYLGACVAAGLGPDYRMTHGIHFDNIELNNDGDRMENKSEVAKGLVKLSNDPMDAILGINDHNKDAADAYDDYGIYDEPSGSSSSKGDVERHEVVGEKHITYRTPQGLRELDELEVLGEEMFKNIPLFGFHDSKFENFNRFIKIFTTFIKKCNFVENVQPLVDGTSGLNNLGAFFVNDSERGAANYRMPIFIASGLYYLENCLMPQIFKRY